MLTILETCSMILRSCFITFKVLKFHQCQCTYFFTCFMWNYTTLLAMNLIINFSEGCLKCKGFDKAYVDHGVLLGAIWLIFSFEGIVILMVGNTVCHQRWNRPGERCTETCLLIVWPVPVAWSVMTCQVWQLRITAVLSVPVRIHSFDNMPQCPESPEAPINYSSLHIHICRPQSHLLSLCRARTWN